MERDPLTGRPVNLTIEPVVLRPEELMRGRTVVPPMNSPKVAVTPGDTHVHECPDCGPLHGMKLTP